MTEAHIPFDLSLRAVLAMIMFAVVSVLIGARVAGAGGWRAVADRYPAPPNPLREAERYRFVSLRMGGGSIGGASYDNCVWVGLSNRGISLALWVPLRLFHPPLLVPWAAVESCTADVLLWGHATRVGLRGGENFRVYGRAGEAIYRWWRQRSSPESTA